METAFIIMTSAAAMPNSCWGIYRNVAVVEVEFRDGKPAAPKMISNRARGVIKVHRHYGPQNVGKTCKCAYQRTLREAESLVCSLTKG